MVRDKKFVILKVSMEKIKGNKLKSTLLKRETKNSSVLVFPVYDSQGKVIQEVKISKKNIPQINNLKLLSHYLRVYLTNQHQGTKSVKTRAEVSGSTRKIYRQKGTGRARHGDIKAPIFVGGGIAHGPKPIKKRLKINKKQIKLAFIYSFVYKLNQGKSLNLIDDSFLKTELKTKKINDVLEKVFQINKEKDKNIFLVIPNKIKANFIKATRNLPFLTTVRLDEINPYFILKAKKLIFTYSAFDQFYQSLFRDENQ